MKNQKEPKNNIDLNDRDQTILEGNTPVFDNLLVHFILCTVLLIILHYSGVNVFLSVLVIFFVNYLIAINTVYKAKLSERFIEFYYPLKFYNRIKRFDNIEIEEIKFVFFYKTGPCFRIKFYCDGREYYKRIDKEELSDKSKREALLNEIKRRGFKLVVVTK